MVGSGTASEPDTTLRPGSNDHAAQISSPSMMVSPSRIRKSNTLNDGKPSPGLSSSDESAPCERSGHQGRFRAIEPHRR